jgi:two-component system, LytTR family, sensor histidine kinase AlgZ
MHPILAQRERFLLYLAAWFIVGGLLAVLGAASGSLLWNESLSVMLPMAIVYAFMCLAALYMCRAFPLRTTNSLKLIVVFLVASTLSVLVWLIIVRGWMAFLSSFEFLPGVDRKFRGILPFLVGIGMLLYLLAAVVHYLILAFEASYEAERHSLEMESLARIAELRALRAQIQPHFLFNCLNAISSLTTSDPARAREMSVRLADFLRKTLRLSPSVSIPMAEELSLVDDFLAIERVRFGNRLRIIKTIGPEALRCTIPPLILQPLVENAVKHGIAHLVEGGEIEIAVTRQGSRLMLVVLNPCDPERPRTTTSGMGLENVRTRLMSAYGNDARCDVHDGGISHSVALSLPAHCE